MKKQIFPYVAALVLAAVSGCVRYDFSLTLSGKPVQEAYSNMYDVKLKIGGADAGGYYRGPGVKDGYFSAHGLKEGEYTIEHVGFMKIGVCKIKVIGRNLTLPDAPSKCAKCNGSGLIACEKCAKCPECSGAGSVECGDCKGSGKIAKKWWFGSKNCEHCNGAGSLTCPSCRSCESCDGKQKVLCPDCVAE